jgi:squalene-hopene/tetraprenyl-beta-curcumene cyclase
MNTTSQNHCRYQPFATICLIALLLVGGTTRGALAADPKSSKATSGKPDQSVKRGVDFLRQAQANDGSFSAASGPGITAIAATALMRSGLTPTDPVVAKALAYVERHRHDDGGIYAEGSRYKNYETSLSIVCFKEANRDGKYDELLANAEKFVKNEQWDEGEGHELSSDNYGGAGYGSHERPDLSNTAFLVDALHAVGAGEDDPALQKALVFISRCQNLESEHNTTEFAAKVDDGGFYYTIAAGGQSQAGNTPDGGLRSYGSMTYAGLKSMIYCGVSPDDPRIKAAYKWIQDHYTLDENPGMGDSGLYYYYHTFAKALDTIGKTAIVDANDKSHDWRKDLAEKLASLQKDDGSWINSNARWLEGDPNLVTSYALLALSYTTPNSSKNAPPVDHIVPPPGDGNRVPKR